MDGQAQAPESEGLDSLADFLSDNPDKETEEELTAEESTSDGDDSDAKPQTDDETEEEVEDEESETEAKEEKPTTEALIEVTVKDKDGNDVVEKVTQTELKNGYIRQAKFTSSMQGLAERETQAVQVFQQKHSELRNNYLQQAEFATQAIARLAGFRSADEMSQLAAQDPASWVQENHRQTQIREILGTIEQQTQAERQHAEQQAEQQRNQTLTQIKERSWAELQKDGMDKPKLQKTYESVMKNYGYEPKDFSTVTDYRLVRMMADAVAYRELKAKAPAVTQQAKAAPKVTTKQTTQATRANTVRDGRFKSGRASLHDLASIL
jgi:hypothetical protein